MARSKYKEAEVRNRRSRNLLLIWRIFFSLMLCVSLFFFFSSTRDTEKEKQIKKDTIPEVTYDLPPSETLYDTARRIPARQWSSDVEIQESLENALKLIVEMKNDSVLTTADDRVILALLDNYRTNPGEMMVGPADEATRDGVGLQFRCSEMKYVVGRNALPVAVVAMNLYHELHHDAVCRGLISRYGIIPGNPSMGDRCRIEAPAYAAEIRFFLAINHRGKWPAEIGRTDGSLSVFKRTMLIWQKLVNHEFCGWIEEEYELIKVPCCFLSLSHS